MVKNPPVSADDGGDLGSIPGLGGPLEKGKATHSSKLTVSGASLIAQLEKIPPAMQETTI